MCNKLKKKGLVLDCLLTVKRIEFTLLEWKLLFVCVCVYLSSLKI